MTHKRYLIWMTLIWAALAPLTQTSWAKDISYQARIEGMRCAFCAYNVSKNIAGLPNVKEQSVKVDLINGHVNFIASAPIEKSSIAARFTDSGFELLALKQVQPADVNNEHFLNEPLIVLKFNTNELGTLDSLLDVIGMLANSNTSQLFIKAPQTAEIDILKPILAGRQHAISVQFLPVESREAQLTLFIAASTTEVPQKIDSFDGNLDHN